MTEARSVFFFFQAEDGIRDLTVTGVQTCALPISRGHGVQHLAVVPQSIQQRSAAQIVVLEKLLQASFLVPGCVVNRVRAGVIALRETLADLVVVGLGATGEHVGEIEPAARAGAPGGGSPAAPAMPVTWERW